MPANLNKVAIFLHAGDYDRVHQGLAIAAAAVSVGRPVEVFWFWWALEKLSAGGFSEPHFPGREDVEDRFESRGAPTIPLLLGHLKESGLCRHYGCTGSLALTSATRDAVEGSVDSLVGWTRILQLTAGVTDRFYL